MTAAAADAARLPHKLFLARGAVLVCNEAGEATSRNPSQETAA